MSTVLQLESSLTDRYQTTIPTPVRKALGLGKRAKIRYELQSDGTVLMSRAFAHPTDDPILGQFLAFLAKDLQDHPRRIQPVQPTCFNHLKSLASGVKVNLDAPLAPTDE